MPQFCWQATANGYYWIDVELGSQPYRCLIDLGLVDPLDQRGFVVAPGYYDALKQAGALPHFRWRYQRDSGGQLIRLESGMGAVQLVDSARHQACPAALEWSSFTD
jgi:hypothetical protein